MCYSGAPSPPPPHNIPLSMDIQQPSFHWYRPMFEVKEIYVHLNENIVTKPTRGASVKFLPVQSE